MRLIPPELTSAIITALGIAGAWLATILSRKGKREDNRIAASNQSFNQLKELAEARNAEIERKDDQLAAKDAQLAARDAEIERIRRAEMERFKKQTGRCRAASEALAVALNAMRDEVSETAKRKADEALRRLEEHRQIDHPEDAAPPLLP